jgi:phage gpG-like protein
MPARIVWNDGRLYALLQGEDGAVAADLLRRAINVETQAKLNATGQNGGPRVQTGRLRASIHHQLERDGQGLVARIGSNVEYARYVEEGTEPHRIVPRVKQALFWPGADHPVLAVNHPGTRARPYLRPALAAARL